MKRDCPIKLDACAGADSPITNISAEAPDPLMFAGVGWPRFDPFKPPPLGNGPYTDEDCLNITWNAVSQSLADFLSQLNAAVCQPPTPPGGTPTWPEYPPIPPFDWNPPSWTPDPETTVTCFNDRQFASLTCPDGSIFTAEIPAGTVAATLPPALCQSWVQYINAWLLAGLLQQIYAAQVCATIPGITDRTPPGVTPPPVPPGTTPTISNYPMWCCLGAALDPSQSTYNLNNAPAGSTWDFQVTGGMIPPGTALVQTSPTSAMMSGTTSVTGTFHFTILATRTDIPGSTVTINDTINVLGISNEDLPDAIINNAYTAQLSGDGGFGPYTFAAIDPLPTGLSLGVGGEITGTPTIAGPYAFNVTVTDTATGGECTIEVSLDVSLCDWIILPVTLPAVTINDAYDQTLTVLSGGTGPYTFAITAGSLPNGISMDGLGHFTGTPNVSGDFDFTVTVTDSLMATCERNYDIIVNNTFDCGTTPTNIQDCIWTFFPDPQQAGCCFGLMANGVCTSWLIKVSDPTPPGDGGPCTGGFHTLQWTTTICNPGDAYDITVSAPYVSAGNLFGDPFPHALNLGLSINANSVVANGDILTDTPNPLVCTLSLPAHATSTIVINLELLAVPDFHLFIQATNTGNLTVTPLTHP